MIANAGSVLSKKRKRPASAKVLASDDLSKMFGIEMAPATPSKRAASGRVASKRATPVNANTSPTPAGVTRLANLNEPAPNGARRRLTPKKRQVIAERMRQYWAERRVQTGTRKGS